MKFIDDRSIKGNPYGYIGLLRRKGILAKHSSEFHNAPHGHLNRKGVWILFEHQFEDSIQLISNPNHLVRDPISKDKMLELEETAKAEFYKASAHFFEKIGVAIVYLTLIGIAFFIQHRVS